MNFHHLYLSTIKKNDLYQKTIRRTKEILTYVHPVINSMNKPVGKFFIFAQGRTGSTLLCDLLNAHPDIHCENEILSNHVFWVKKFIESKCTICSEKIYGFKVKLYQLTQNQNIRNPEKLLLDLHADGWKVIYLYRNDLFRHAISSLIAEHNNIWHKKKTEYYPENQSVFIDCYRLIQLMNSRKDCLIKEKEVLKNIPHIKINYELELLKAESHQKTIDKVFDYLGIYPIKADTKYARTTPDDLDGFIKNYDEVMDFIKKKQL